MLYLSEFMNIDSPAQLTGNPESIPLFYSILVISLSSHHSFDVSLFRYLISAILFWRLITQIDLVPPSIKHLQFGRFLKNGKLVPLSLHDQCTDIMSTKPDLIRF